MDLSEVQSLDGYVKYWASCRPEKTFIEDAARPGGTAMSFSKANANIDDYARSIARIDGTTIGLALTSSIEAVCLFYAILRAGKNVVLLDPRWGDQVMATAIEVADIAAVVGRAAADHARLQPLRVDLATGAGGVEARRRPSKKARIIVFSSGTTTSPKAIVLTQKAMLYAYEVGRQCLDVTEEHRVGCFYRASGLGILGINFLFPHTFGASVVLLPEYVYLDCAGFWECIEDHDVTYIYMVPPIAHHLVRTSESGRSYSKGNVLCLAASACLEPEVQEVFQERFAPLANIYGLSECGFAFLFGQKRDGKFTNAVGIPRGIEVRLWSGGKIVREPNVNGILHVRTGSMFEGYLKNPKQTGDVLREEWLNSKDVAYYDDTGAVHLVGRSDDALNKGGNLFYLSEAEEFLRGSTMVLEAACTKVPCRLYGEDYVAVVRLKADGDLRQLRTSMAEKLGALRAPKHIVATSAYLPKNASGKYDGPGLRRLAASDEERGGLCVGS